MLTANTDVHLHVVWLRRRSWRFKLHALPLLPPLPLVITRRSVKVIKVHSAFVAFVPARAFVLTLSRRTEAFWGAGPGGDAASFVVVKTEGSGLAGGSPCTKYVENSQGKRLKPCE